MSALQLNIILKRKQSSEGARIAEYEQMRVIAIRQLHERNTVSEIFPHGAREITWEWLVVGDDTELKGIWDADFQEMLTHYEVVSY